MKGHLYQRGPVWWYRCPLPANKQYRKSLNTTDHGVAEQRAIEHEAKVLRGVGLDGSMTLTRWVDAWLAELADLGRQPTTLRTYRHVADRYLLPRIGKVRLDALTPTHVERMDQDLLRHGGRTGGPLSPVTVKQAHDCLCACLHEAMRKRHISENVAALARRPKVPESRPHFLDRDEALRLLEAAREHPWGAFAAVTALTGLRAGEMCGLRWRNVDLRAGTLRVEWQRRYDGPEIGFIDAPPKSASGVRSVPLSPEAVEWLMALAQRRDRHTRLGGAADAQYVFGHDGRGKTRGRWVPWTPQAAARGVGDLYQTAGLEVPARPIHALRHTCGTLLADAREDPKVRAALLGHSRVTTTYGYTHVSGATGRRAMGEVGKRLGPAQKPAQDGGEHHAQ